MSANLYAPPAPHPLAGQVAVQRLKLWGLCLVTMIITCAIIRTVKVVFGMDLFSLTFWVFVPVGAMMTALAATSGFALGAAWMKWKTDIWDLVFLMAVCLMLQALLVGVDYAAMLFARPQGAAHHGFGRFFVDSVTKVEYTMHSQQFGTSRPEVIGEAGWILLMPRIGCVMAIAKFIHGSFEQDKGYQTS